jgi:hypothetical protein
MMRRAEPRAPVHDYDVDEVDKSMVKQSCRKRPTMVRRVLVLRADIKVVNKLHSADLGEGLRSG